MLGHFENGKVAITCVNRSNTTQQAHQVPCWSELMLVGYKNSREELDNVRFEARSVRYIGLTFGSEYSAYVRITNDCFVEAIGLSNE